jgi:hypothetical protein
MKVWFGVWFEVWFEVWFGEVGRGIGSVVFHVMCYLVVFFLFSALVWFGEVVCSFCLKWWGRE